MIDKHSGYSMVRFLKLKNEAAEAVISIICDFENLCKDYAKNTDASKRRMDWYLRSDGRNEYATSKLQNWP